ncbi:MAG: tRNA preQ1(34) S-adenosylmethionine ribosyltransferase-isomerase QueA [Gemmataceae bacterium]
MDIDELDYELPAELIAQEPIEPRDHSRLMVLNRADGRIRHHLFKEIGDFLPPQSLLLLNDTRVVPARLVGIRPRTGGKWEGLFVREHSAGLWEVLLKTRGTLKPGEFLAVGDLRLETVEKTAGGRWLLRPCENAPWDALLAKVGQVPIPPYIHKGRARSWDEQRYQTVHARRKGAVAAPTAGLHFTEELFAELERRGYEKAFVTLHVGPGTFQPIKVHDVREHQVEAEWGELPAATADAIHRCVARGGKRVAVGTTSVRLLESAARQVEPLQAWSGATDLTIMPPYSFRVVDALVTNFHLPRSSLLLLVGAFAGLSLVKAAYAEAVRERYRFYSYGDAMLIL